MRTIDAYQRREEILKLLFATPMPTVEVSQTLDLPLMEVKNDIAFLKRHGLVISAGKFDCVWNGRPSKFQYWKAPKEMTARDMEAMAYARKNSGTLLPDLPEAILLMMGYTSHEPKGGVFVDNADFKPTYDLRKMQINIGNHWGIMMENSQ